MKPKVTLSPAFRNIRDHEVTRSVSLSQAPILDPSHTTYTFSIYDNSGVCCSSHKRPRLSAGIKKGKKNSCIVQTRIALLPVFHSWVCKLYTLVEALCIDTLRSRNHGMLRHTMTLEVSCRTQRL